MIDFHTHLDLYPDALAILPKVNELNKFTLAVTTSPRAWIATSKVFSKYPLIKVALGLHPEIVEKKQEETSLFLDSIPKSKFIGEIGIDGSFRFSRTISLQESIFEQIIKKCGEVGGRIMSIHSRSAASKVLSILERFPSIGTTILHWFSGSIKELEIAVSLGCWFSVGPAMLDSRNGRLLASKMPKGRILPESDGPFATKHGQTIMPWEAIDITNELSKLWETTEDKARDILFDNYEELLKTNNLEI